MAAADPIRIRFWRTTPGRNLLWGVAALALGLFIWFVGISCLFHDLTGLYCPGCGATRAVKALARGDIGLALHDNAWLILFAGPALLLSAISNIWSLNEATRRRLHKFMLVTGYAAALFFVIRNLPFAPFNLLRPLP